MKRFLVFPLIGAFIGSIFFLITFIEGALPLSQVDYFGVEAGNYSLHFTGYSLEFWRIKHIISNLFTGSYKQGIFIGAIVGFGFSIWDFTFNKSDEDAEDRLGLNLFWCSLYTSLIVAINIGVFHALFVNVPDIFYRYERLQTLPVVSATLLNFTAIIWAAIRSITTDDVLTPRVLRAKLRERSRLD